MNYNLFIIFQDVQSWKYKIVGDNTKLEHIKSTSKTPDYWVAPLLVQHKFHE